jgi:hypothetical protein
MLRCVLEQEKPQVRGVAWGAPRPRVARRSNVVGQRRPPALCAHRWQSAINTPDKTFYLGSFHDEEEEEAARAFDRAALRLRGIPTKINFNVSEYTDQNVGVVGLSGRAVL